MTTSAEPKHDGSCGDPVYPKEGRMSDDAEMEARGYCMACDVGVATGPESHARWCLARDIPMPEQDGQWGPEWDEYDAKVAAARASFLEAGA